MFQPRPIYHTQILCVYDSYFATFISNISVVVGAEREVDNHLRQVDGEFWGVGVGKVTAAELLAVLDGVEEDIVGDESDQTIPLQLHTINLVDPLLALSHNLLITVLSCQLL